MVRLVRFLPHLTLNPTCYHDLNSTLCSSKTARAPKRSEAELISLVPHYFACNPVFVRGVRYRCAQRGNVYYAVVRSILLYGCETLPVGVVDQKILAIFDNDSIRRVLFVMRRDCVPSEELCCHIHLTSIPTQLMQRQLCLFGHAARYPKGWLIRNFPLAALPRS